MTLAAWTCNRKAITSAAGSARKISVMLVSAGGAQALGASAGSAPVDTKRVCGFVD